MLSSMKRGTGVLLVTGGLLAGAFTDAPEASAADDTVVPNENLVVDGIPKIPRSYVERVAAYSEQRSAAFLDWHPLRREILIATRFGDVPQIHQVVAPGAARTQLTFYPERVSFARWRPKAADGFVFSKDIGGGEFFQLYWRDAASGKTTLLTDGKSRNTGGTFSRDGELMAYESTRRNKKDNDIYVMSPKDPKSDRLVLQVDGGGWNASDFSPDRKSLLVDEEISINESRIHLLDLATGTKSQLSPAGEKAFYGGANFSRDGKRIYLVTDHGSEFKKLASIDLASKKLEILSAAIPWDVTSYTLSDDGKKLAFLVNEGGAETIHLLELPSHRPLPLPKTPLGTIGGLRFHSNSKDLGFSLSSARSATDVYSIDTSTGKLERWTESETGGLDASRFSEPQSISWKSFDGKMISGFLYKPAASFAGPRPVIVNIHGGPESQFQPGFLGRNNFLLDELGVALVFPNVRGSSGFGKTFLSLDDGAKREDSVKDIGALLDWIKGQPGLDASRVMVTGGSYGGYMTLASMTHDNNRFRCALDVVGISNFVTFLEHTESYRQDLRRVEYGDERDPKMREILTSISPLTNVSKISKPMFIVQGKNDPRVPFTEAEQMVAAIKKNGGPVWYLLANDEGHGFSKKKNADFQFLATIRFIEEHLLN